MSKRVKYYDYNKLFISH